MALFAGVRAAGACVRSGAVTRSFSSSVVALDGKKDVIGVVGLGLMGHGIAQVNFCFFFLFYFLLICRFVRLPLPMVTKSVPSR